MRYSSCFTAVATLLSVASESFVNSRFEFRCMPRYLMNFLDSIVCPLRSDCGLFDLFRGEFKTMAHYSVLRGSESFLKALFEEYWDQR